MDLPEVPGADGNLSEGIIPHSRSLLCASPEKTHMRPDEGLQDDEVSHAVTGTLSLNSLHPSIASYPVSNQPVMDTLLKDMLLSLQSSLHADLAALTHKFSSEIHRLGEKVNHIENSLGKINVTVNDLVDAHDDNLEGRCWLKAKIADREDRSHQINLKLRGVP